MTLAGLRHQSNTTQCMQMPSIVPSHNQSHSTLQGLNPLKMMQTRIAQTKRDKIVAQRRKNYQEKKKTELCKNYLFGEPCPLGERCSFAHGEEELKPKAFHNYKTVKCRHFHEKGFCQYGPRCQFLHNDRKGEIRNVHMEYSQLLRIMNDAFILQTAEEAEADDISQHGHIDENLIGFEQSGIQKLQIFQRIRGEAHAL